MARYKKIRSLKSSPVSKGSQRSQQEGSLNPTIGGCSGNTSSAEGGREVKLDEENKVERKIKEELKRKDSKELHFPSALDLPPPMMLGERVKVEESWWRGLEEDAKCIQAWTIWFGLTGKANVYLASGDAFIISNEEKIAGRKRAEVVLLGTELDRQKRMITLPKSVVPQVSTMFETLLDQGSSRIPCSTLPLAPWPLALQGKGMWGDYLWAAMRCVICHRWRHVSPTAGHDVDLAVTNGFAQCSLLQGAQCHDDTLLSVCHKWKEVELSTIIQQAVGGELYAIDLYVADAVSARGRKRLWK